MHSQLHLVANASDTSGGEGLAAYRYAESLSKAGCSVTLMSTCMPSNAPPQTNDGGGVSLEIVPSRRRLLAELIVQYRYIDRVCAGNHVSVLHIHGIWTPLLAVAALVAHRRRLPLVISPHGCLEPWALNHKRTKKWLALKTYQGVVLRWASLFVATAEQEAESILRLGLRQPIALIPNGVDVKPLGKRRNFGDTKTILFLSRIHPQKGLRDLVGAWGLVRRNGWAITVAGGDEGGHLAEIEALVRAAGLEADFEFLGFVEGARKQACFESADIFVLPSYSENFGIAVAEALAYGLPVITTTGTPWRELVEQRCGWWVEPGVRGISMALSDAMAQEPDALREMGERGRTLVSEKYSWANIGRMALEVGEWLVNRSLPKPSHIRQGDGT